MSLFTTHHYAVRTLSIPGTPKRSGMVDPGWTPALSYGDAYRYLESLGVTPAAAAIALERAHLNRGDGEPLTSIVPDTATGLEVWAVDRGVPALFRVSYLNPIDGLRHVLLAGLERFTAESLAESNRELPEVAVEADDGTPDGAVIDPTTTIGDAS